MLRRYVGRHWTAAVYSDRIETTIKFSSLQSATVVGRPPDTPEFLKSAQDLGYGDDIYWHIIEHELLHSIVAEELWDIPSYSLSAQARNQNAYRQKPPPPAKLEEKVVGEVQAALNGIRWGFDRLCYRGHPHPRLIVLAASMLRPMGEAMTIQWAEQRAPKPEPRKYCHFCGAGPREYQECEDVRCDIREYSEEP